MQNPCNAIGTAKPGLSTDVAAVLLISSAHPLSGGQESCNLVCFSSACHSRALARERRNSVQGAWRVNIGKIA
jgi:hypothetical protein